MDLGKEVTIYDVARKLNISPATVSRGLQDHPAISRKTKDRILAMANELGYRTNHAARNLRQQQTNTIGVIVHELNSTFITSVLAGIEKISTEAGYDLIIAHSSESVIKEAANARNLFQKRVDGLIASLSFETSDLEHFQPFRDKKVPLIFFDRVEQDGQDPVVIIDNAKCGYLATKHLIEQGCNRIAHITSNLKRNVYAQRYKGYCDALYDNGMPVREEYVLVKDLSEKGAVDSALQILGMNPRPDGVFITSDFIAAVCIQQFKEHGVRVPQDIAVVGFNNDAISKLIDPPLTTVNYPGVDIGEIAARNLINHLKGISDIQQAKTVIVASELIVRKSSLRQT